VFEVTNDEVWVVAVQFAIRDPADLEAEEEPAIEVRSPG
jgi:hypothetical protein